MIARRSASVRVLVLALAGLAAGCRPSPDAPRKLGTRAVVIGLDGADWTIVDELSAEGRMPNLKRLRERGAWGLNETLADIPLSPVIWTSIATGKTAAKHGISWFMVDEPGGTRVPVRSTNRKVKAVWNLLADAGRRPVVVGWWATYPAEAVGKGVVVSDALGFHGFGATAREGDDGKKTYPAALYGEVFPLVPPDQQLSHDFVSRFVHVTAQEYRQEMFDPGRYPHRDPANPIHLFQEYAVTAQGYAAIAEKLLGEERADLFLVYFEQIDSFSHLFMKYAPPPLDWVDPRQAARYEDVVREWYAYQDELLGRLLARVDLETTAVFVLSDHGFKSGERRIRSEETVDVKRAHLDHEPHGVFLAAGPHIRRGAEVRGASVLDLTPTLLHYLGFPVAKDMDGKVLEGIFEPAFLEKNPIRYVASYEDATTPAATPVAQAETATDAETAERMEALRSLGYLGGGDEGGGGAATPGAAPGAPAGASGAGAGTSPEMHNNMGRIFLRDGRPADGRREFEKALEADPRNADALLNLASVNATEGRAVEAEHLVRRALQVDPDSVAALAQLASIRRDQDDLEEAVRLFEEAVRIDPSLPFVHVGYGDVLQRAGRYAEAEREFKKVLELEPDSFQAHYNLGVVYDRLGRAAEAETAYLKAIEKAPRDPEADKAYNNLGSMELARGDADAAVAWFEKAVKASPVNLEARYNLAVEKLRRDKVTEAVKLLEEAARLSPNHELVNLRLGFAYSRAGRGEDAYRSLTLVRRLYPKNWAAAVGLAALHAASGQPEEARRLLDEAVRLGGKEARTFASGFVVLEPLVGATPAKR